MILARLRLAFCATILILACAPSAEAGEIASVYTQFDADKTCRHTPGSDEEDYGSWRCPGYGKLLVFLSAGDQRMQVTFGTSSKRAFDEVAAGETFPGFNSVYSGTVEWRGEKMPDGSFRPFRNDPALEYAHGERRGNGIAGKHRAYACRNAAQSRRRLPCGLRRCPRGRRERGRPQDRGRAGAHLQMRRRQSEWRWE